MAIKFPSYRKKVALLLAIIESFVFAGTIFGWNSLTHVFQAQGYFASETKGNYDSYLGEDYEDINSNVSPSSPNINPHYIKDEEQDKMFNLVFIWALFFLYFSSILTGWMFDAYGTRRSKIILIIALSFGYTLFGLSSKETPWLLFPASVIVAVCGNGLMITNVHIGNMFIQRRSLVISLLYGFFESSGSVAQVVTFFFNLGISTRVIFYTWALSCTFLLINALKVLPAGKVSWPPSKEYFDVAELRRRNQAVDKLVQSTSGVANPQQKRPQSGANSNLMQQNKANNFSMMLVAEDPRFKSYADDVNLSYQVENFGRASASSVTLQLPVRENTMHPYESIYSTGNTSLRQDFEETGLCRLMMSGTYMLQVVWFVALSFIINFYIGTYYFWIKHLSKTHSADELEFDANVAHYTKAFQFALFTGFIWCPFAGLVLDRHRKDDKVFTHEEEMEHVVLPLYLTSILALVFQLSLLLTDFWMPILYFSSILMALIRGFVFTLGGVYFVLIFPSKYFGKLLGVQILVCSFTIFAQYYVQNIITTTFNGDPFTIHILFALLAFVSLIHPANLFCLCFHRNKKRKWINKHIDTEERVIYI